MAGKFVRYDGKSEYRNELYQKLAENFSLLTFCPEVAIGQPIPRLPIHIRQTTLGNRAIDKQTGQKDYTIELENYAKLVATRYPNLKAYIFKQSSPSCGLGKTKLHDNQGQFIDAFTDGIFSKILKRKLPKLLVYTEDQLQETEEIERLICLLLT